VGLPKKTAGYLPGFLNPGFSPTFLSARQFSESHIVNYT